MRRRRRSLSRPIQLHPRNHPGPRNDGAGYDNSDAEIPLTQSDEEQEERPKQKRKRVIAEYELVKRWVIGERAVLAENDIERELFEEVRELIHLSGLKKLPGHKVFDTDLHLSKKASPDTIGYVIHYLSLSFAASVQVHEDFPRRER